MREVGRDDACVTLEATLPPCPEPVEGASQEIDYATRTGALLRLDGAIAGAYDREHRGVVVDGADRTRRVTLEVERHSLPANGLPSGPGFSWWLMSALSHPRPSMQATLRQSFETLRQAQDKLSAARAPQGDIAHDGIELIGHSHLDIAWLWTYQQSRRKALRTFAIAVELLRHNPSFVFVQSMPQLYRFVQEDDPELYERVRELARAGRFDADVAGLWVESDCNLPSGESLLRQMLYAHRYCEREFGIAPSIAWLPDTFGFANTLPTLLAHAGIRRFLTTKLEWNDTTRFPYPQFRWRGPDGSEVVGALAASYEGGISQARVSVARSRREPLVAGYGDGGGGVTDRMLADARGSGRWIRPRDWFAGLEADVQALPVHADELYLEYHRGVYTTHHDVKARNAALERGLAEAEELVAWCVAVRVAPARVAPLREQLAAAWETLLRHQFHDVLPGTSITDVYKEVAREYDRCEELVASVRATALAFLPRAARAPSSVRREPSPDGAAFVLENELIRARVLPDGTIDELIARDGRNVAVRVNDLRAYRDRPRQWEAWNVDAGYDRRQYPVRATAAHIRDGSLEITFLIGQSPATMRLTLAAGDPFLRVELATDWRERRTLLRIENRLGLTAECARFGTPHGTIERSAAMQTPAEQAKFEVPGQRFALVKDERGAALAILALDTYGWSARGGTQFALGHSLLRGTCWPDPHADRGLQHHVWAFAPLGNATVGDVERIWLHFAHEPGVKLFVSEHSNVIVVACKPAEDGDGVIVRARECDGMTGEMRLRCSARMREVEAVDGLERPREHAEARTEAESLLAPIVPFGLCSFRVRF